MHTGSGSIALGSSPDAESGHLGLLADHHLAKVQARREAPLADGTEFTCRPLEASEIKVHRRKRTVEGHWNVFGNVDEGGDQIMPGSFDKTIERDGPEGTNRIKFFWQHELGIGMPTELIADERSLFGRAKVTDHPDFDRFLALIADGVAGDLSIGWLPLKREFIDDEDTGRTVRRVTEARLFEGSPVYWPMNLLSRITALKASGDALRKDAPLGEALRFLAAAEIQVSNPALSAQDAKQVRDVLIEIGERSTETLEALGFLGIGGGKPAARKAESVRGEPDDEGLTEALEKALKEVADLSETTKAVAREYV